MIDMIVCTKSETRPSGGKSYVEFKRQRGGEEVDLGGETKTVRDRRICTGMVTDRETNRERDWGITIRSKQCPRDGGRPNRDF